MHGLLDIIWNGDLSYKPTTSWEARHYYIATITIIVPLAKNRKFKIQLSTKRCDIEKDPPICEVNNRIGNPEIVYCRM